MTVCWRKKCQMVTANQKNEIQKCPEIAWCCISITWSIGAVRKSVKGQNKAAQLQNPPHLLMQGIYAAFGYVPLPWL